MAKKQTFQFFFNQLVKGYRSIMGKDPEGLDLIKIKQEANQKLIDQDKVIEVQFGKPFSEEVNKLIESGDVKIGEVTKKNDNVLQREMFQNSNLNKPTIEGQMEKINAASKRLDDIMKEREEMYRPKTDAEIKAKFEKQNKDSAERLRKKIKDEPEDKADGGRMGFAGGKIVLGKKILDLLKNNKKIQEAVDSIFGTGDYKMDAEMAAESLVENNPKTFGGKLYEDLDDATRSEIYGAVLQPITTNMAKMRELKKASRPEKTLAAMEEGKGIDMSDPGISEEFTRFMKETDPEGYKKLEQTVELSNFNPKGRKKNSDGGRAGFYTGGITDVEPSLDDIGHGSDSLMSRTRLMSPGSQTTTSTGLNYLLAEDNDNLRVPFAKGKIAKEVLDKGRRGFMKAAGAAGAGIAALKTGLLGFGEKAAPVVETAVQTAKETAQGVPPYFFRLVEKIKFMGEPTLATKDKSNAYKFKDYVMEEDFAGNIEIIKKGEDLGGNKLEDVYMSYKVDEVPTKVGKKGSAKVEEYEEFTARPDAEGKMKDIEPGIPDEVVEEAGDIEAMTLKKAEGGRIGFNKGKLVMEGGRKFLEKVFGKEKLKNIVENDPELEQGMLEIVDMFRKKDKEGLKMYLQKYLPHMDDVEIEDFIVGSGDTAGIEGQLIRLGSGRDYKGKIDMIEEANNMRKLEDFDIDGVSKNAEGGRIPYFKGGIAALKGILNYFAEQAGKKGSDQLKDINPKVLPSGIENIMGPEHMKMLKENQTGYLESLLQIIKSDKKFVDNVNNRVKEMVKTAPKGFEDVAENIANQMVKSSMKDKRFDRMKVYDKINIDDAIVDVEQMIKNRRVKESDGRALNALGGLQTMLGE